MSTASPARPLGLRIIIGYKLVKAPVMLGLALWLTFGEKGASAFVARMATDLAEGGWLLRHIGQWLGLHLSDTVFRGAAIAAWLDTCSTTLEAVLLLMGKAWGEWLVVAGLGCLIPVELFWLGHHPAWGRFGVLIVNTIVFGYLLWRRLRSAPPLRAVPQ